MSVECCHSRVGRSVCASVAISSLVCFVLRTCSCWAFVVVFAAVGYLRVHERLYTCEPVCVRLLAFYRIVRACFSIVRGRVACHLHFSLIFLAMQVLYFSVTPIIKCDVFFILWFAYFSGLLICAYMLTLVQHIPVDGTFMLETSLLRALSPKTEIIILTFIKFAKKCVILLRKRLTPYKVYI